MATVSAESSPAHTRSSRPDPTRRIWQVPVFLLGVAAFVSVWQGWVPIGPPDPASAFQDDLLVLKATLERVAPEIADLKSCVNRVAQQSQQYPELAPVVHFALGSGYIRLAELSADPGESQSYWRLARQHLDSLHLEDIPEADRGRLEYRQAKARAAELPRDAAPAEIEHLRTILMFTPGGEQSGDGPRFVAELSLRLMPPDLKRARDSLTAFIAEAGLATPAATLARAKLRLSEVYLALGDHDQAKKWLGQIGTDAPADVMITGKGQLARIRMADRDYEGAGREWELLRSRPELSSELRAAAAYHLGVCRQLAKAAKPEEAVKLFEEAVKSTGPEGPAAAVRLADLYLGATDLVKHRESVRLLSSAVKDVAAPGEYTNPLVPLNEVQAAFEKAVRVLTQDQAFESAVAAAEAYRSVATAGHDREKLAEATVAWGSALPKGSREAIEKFTAAADEYVALAENRPADTDKAEQLRRAADLYRQAALPDKALTTLEKVLQLPSLPDEVKGSVGLDYAESLLAANRPKEALRVFTDVMARSGPASTIARYRLARLLLDTRDPQKIPLGVALLEQIAQAEQVAPAEQAAHERALVELAHEQIRAGNFAGAESRLRTQLRLYPTGPEVGLGELLLGVCLIQRADPRAKPAAPDPAKAREEALAVLKKLVGEIDARTAAGQATERDPWLKKQAALRVLQVYLQMNKPWDLITTADPMRRESAGAVEELIILSFMYHAYKQLDKPEGMLTIRDQMQAAYVKLKDKPGAFWAKSGEYSRDYWEKVWFSPKKEEKK